MSNPENDKLKKWRRWATLAGIVLAIACNLAPPDYRTVCQAVVQFCAGGG